MWELRIEYPDGEVKIHFSEDKEAFLELLDKLTKQEQDASIPPVGTKFIVSKV